MPDEIIISDSSTGAPRFRVTVEDDKTVIRDFATNAPRFVLDGEIGGNTVEVMTTAERTAITPDEGQLIYDSELEALYVGDGVTAGGVAVAAGGSGGATPIIGSTVSGGTAFVTLENGGGTVAFVGVGGATFSEGDDGEIELHVSSGGGGEGTVTGIEASVSGNTATIEATGSTTSVKLVGKDGVLVQGNTNGEVEFGVPAVSKHAVFSNSAATLAANTELVAVENCDNMKNDYITFFANFETFDTLTIKHFISRYSQYVKITTTDVEIYDYQDTLKNTYPHGLTFSSFIYVVLYKQDNGSRLSDISIMTAGGSFVKRDIFIYGTEGAVVATATSALTNANINYIVSDTENSVWVFGDSYISFWSANSWAYQYIQQKHENVMFIGNIGETTQAGLLSFTTLVGKAIPRYAVWALGQNNPDNNSISSSWKTATDSFVETCKNLGIEPILCTIPCTPNHDNTYKNAYVKSLGLRYVDFAKAVNAEAAGSTWYSGMLMADELHPTSLGATAHLNQFLLDVPEAVFNDGVLLSKIKYGWGLEVDGITVSKARYTPVTATLGYTVTLKAGYGYKVDGVFWHPITLNREAPETNSWGDNGYLQLIVSDPNYISAGDNVVFLQPLEPDAVNNCTVRFIGNLAVISIDNHAAGYIVKSLEGTTAGSLYYGIATDDNQYICINADLDGKIIDISGATANSEKHIVGNGYTKTVLSGAINCANKITVANLGLNGVIVSGGVLQLGDAYIPNGGRLTVGSGGELAIRNVFGDDSIIDLGKTHVGAGVTNGIFASGITFTNGTGSGGGAVAVNGRAGDFVSCTFSGNTGTGPGGAIVTQYNANARFVSCTITGNTSTNGGGCFCDQAVFEGCTISGNTNSDIRFTDSRAVVSAQDCVFGLAYTSRGKLYLAGSNHFDQIVGASATVLIAEGAIVDMTGATAATTINPGGGITLYGGSQINHTKIYGSEGSATQLREFGAKATITGSAITKIGAITGATVALASSSCQVEFIKSGEATVSSAFVQAADTPYVLATEQGAGTVLVRVIED